MKKAFLQLHIAIFLAGFTGILGRLITLNEGLLVWYRLFITSVTMWILFSLQKKLQKVTRKDAVKLVGVGFLSALHWVAFYGAIKYASVSVALVCFSGVGFFTALFEPLILKERVKWIEVLLGVLVMLGIYIIFHFDPRYKTGIVLGILAALFIAIAIVILRQFTARYNGATILTWQLSGGMATLSCLMPIYLSYFPVQSLVPGWGDLAWLLVLSWLCSVLAFQFSMEALKKLSAFTVNLNFNLEPVYGIALAFLIYRENEMLNGWFFVGLAIIGGSLVIHTLLLMHNHRQKRHGTK